jgi:hypothetical protein
MGFFDAVSRGIKILELVFKNLEIFATCINIVPTALIILLAIMILSFVFDRYRKHKILISHE